MKANMYFFILLSLSLYHIELNSQNVYTEIYPHYKIPITYEVLNTKELSNKYQGSVLDYSYTSLDGTSIQIKSYRRGGEIEVFERPPFPAIHIIYKEFFGNGRLKQKGVFLPNQCKIGNWLAYDKSGNGWITDHENGRTQFGYNHILEHLTKLGYYNYNPGQSAHNWNCIFLFTPESHSWGVRVDRDGAQYRMYTFDCKGEAEPSEEDLTVVQSPTQQPIKKTYNYNYRWE